MSCPKGLEDTPLSILHEEVRSTNTVFPLIVSAETILFLEVGVQ